jgi:hypothetical protein
MIGEPTSNFSKPAAEQRRLGVYKEKQGLEWHEREDSFIFLRNFIRF